MPSPITLAASVATRGYKWVSNTHWKDALAATTLTIGTVLGYEELTENQDFPEPALPSSKTKLPYRSPINPTVKTVLEPLHKDVVKNTTATTDNFKMLADKLSQTVESIKANNDSMLVNASDSPFLQNQVASKDSIDSISLNLEAQTILMGSIWESLENNLSALVAVKMVEAQNAKVLTDYQKTIADQSDLGQYFYEFIPTSEFWAKADAAYILRQQQLGWAVVEAWYPSRISSAREIELIDSMEGYYSNAQIRGEVEAFRKGELSSDIRALIGQTALSQAKDQTETNAKAKEYYTAATESIRAKEVPEALTNLIQAVAPVAQWAESAKVREDYLTTPTAVKDLDGNIIADDTAPMAVTIAKDAAMAREKTDTINLEFDSVDMPEMLDVFPLMSFFGRESVFSPSALPTNNPFMPA